MSTVARRVHVTAFLIAFALAASRLVAQEPSSDSWRRVALAGGASTLEWSASSVLESSQPLTASRYGPEQAFDGDSATAWVEGVEGPGIGEGLTIGLPSLPEAFGLINGYAKNRDLFERNGRLKRMKVRVYAGVMIEGFTTELADLYDVRPISEERAVELLDTTSPQRVPLPVDHAATVSRMEEFRGSPEIAQWRFPEATEMGAGPGRQLEFRYIITLRIDAVYPGREWEDTCLSDLWPDYGAVSGVAVSNDDRSLLVRAPDGDVVVAYRDPASVLTLVDTSPDERWALLIREPADAGSGRVATRYALVHTPTGREMTNEVLARAHAAASELLPTGFTMANGVVYLEYEDLSSGTGGRAACSLY